MNHSFRIAQLFIISFLVSVAGMAQDITSPYSIIGIGDLENSYYNRNSGMANTGISLRSGKNLYQANPASYSALDNQFFTFELGAVAKTVTYKGDNIDPSNNNNSDFIIKKVAAGFKITRRWGVGFGLSPFSSVSYLFNVNHDNTLTSVEGNGGLNQLTMGHAYRITKNFSLGVNAAYLFGSVKQTESLVDPYSQSVLATTLNSYYRKLNLTYGLQYLANLNKKLDYNLGLIYSPENKLSGETGLLVTNNTTEIIRDETLKATGFTLPATYGIGMSLTKNRLLTFAADYKYENWSDTKYRNQGVSLVNSQRYSAGVDFNKVKAERDALYEIYNLQAGVFFKNSELNINGEQLTEYGFTVGAGKPVSRGRINLNLALEVGTRGTTHNGLIKENYGQLTLNISYRDYWLTRGRKYD